jgi:hypothetical protein
MKKLVVILPRGEAIKNFVYSGITDTLREKYKVIFFSVIPNASIKAYLESKCDHLYALDSETKNGFYASEVKKCIEIAHAKNLNSVTGNLKLLKDDVLSKRKIHTRLIRIFRKRIASFFVSDKKLEKLTRYYTKLQYKKREVIHYERILQEIQPDLVFNTSHIHNAYSLDAVYASKKLQIKTATFLFSWDNLTSQGRIIPSYDYYFTWNQKIKNDLLSYYPYIKKENVYITGSPQFDFHFMESFTYSKEELCKILQVPVSKKIILYSTGMAFYTPKEHLIVKELHERLKTIDKDAQLVVRIYAKDDNTAYYKLRDSDNNIKVPDHYWELNHLTPTIEDIKLFTSLVKHAAVGINVASTVSLDLAIHDTPVINIAFNPSGVDIYPNDYVKIYDFDHYKPIVKSGAVSLSYSIDEFETQVTQYLNKPSTDGVLRAQLIKDFFGDELKKDKRNLFLEIFNSILE